MQPLNSVGGIIAEEIIAPLLIEFQMCFPDIRIRLDFSSPKIDVLANEYDDYPLRGKPSFIKK